MSVSDFFNEHKKIIIAILILIVILIIYRYFWGKHSVANDLNETNLKNQIDALEQNINQN